MTLITESNRLSQTDPQPSTLSGSASPRLPSQPAIPQGRISIPINLENWKTLAPPIQDSLLWFHQHAMDQALSWKDCCEALNYNQSTIFRVLKGTYEGNWENIGQAIDSYRKIWETRGTIQQNEFVENRHTKRIFAGLDYALANNSITLIVSESRTGKSMAAQEWAVRNNHGRSVYVVCPPLGGARALIRAICKKIGANQHGPVLEMLESIYKAFNKNRILIVDEAHRLLPPDRRTNPVNLEILRDLHDQTHCALAIIATERFEQSLSQSKYMFEQVIGRIGMPIRLQLQMKSTTLCYTREDILPILVQYIPRPSADIVGLCLEIANDRGRLGLMVETLKVASRIAAKAGTRTNEEHLRKAIKLRKDMSGTLLA